MTDAFQIQPASENQRLAAYRNVHEVWSDDLPLDEFLARRLRSVMHNRAEWFVLCVGQSVASSLGRYPLQFNLGGTIVKGSGIGAVHTPPEHRQRGYATALLRQVNEWSRRDGFQVSLLFSDIDPAYYERLGYITWPSYISAANVARLRCIEAVDISATSIKVAENEVDIRGQGSGPIDAFIDAMVATLNEPLNVVDYQEYALNEGAEAQAICILALTDERENRYYGVGISQNTTTAAFKSIIAAVNRKWR